MSWAKDEWKDGLNVYVLKHITELEQQNERIAKDNKQKQFQIETQTAAFLKQKRFTEEEKGRNASLKRENQSLSESCDEAERSNQKLQHEIHLKDGRISCVEGQLNRLKQSLDHEISKQSQLKADLEKVQCEHTQSLKKFEKQCADLSKIQEHNNFQKRQIEGQKEKIKSLITQLKHGDFEVRSSRSSSQSSSEGTYDDYNGIDLQAKLETEVQQRQRIEQELKQLQEQQNIRPKEAETPVTKLPSESHNNLDVFTKEGIESSKMELEYKNSLSKIELQLQASKNELMNKIEVLKERDVQLAELKQNLDEQVKESGRSAEDLMKTKTELDRTKSQFELFERKSKQLTQELQCQRHNSEAVIKGHEERIKEKEKQYREELSTQSQALVALDKQHRDLMAKMKQEQNITQAAQRELHGKLDQKLQEAEKLKRQLDDIKLDGSNKDHAMKTKEQTINDLSQEIKSLKQEKTCLLADLDREASCKKKLEDQLKAAKSEIELKSNLMKNAETKATEQVKELEKIRQQVLCDLENERTVRSKLEHDIEELKKLVNASTCSTEKRENEVEEVKKKLEVSDKDNQRLCQETQQLKVTISEQNDQQLKFEAKLKEVDQVTVGKDNETRNMVDKLEELEKKCSSLLHELDNKSHELEISKRTNSELQSKQENMQKILTAKEMEVKKLKKTAFEIETQQSSAKNAEVSELERRLDDERQSCKRVQDDCNKLKSELNDGKVTENELRYKLQEISTALKENQDIVSQKEKEIEGERKNIKSSMQEFKEKIALLKKEKEQQKQEMSKTIHQNSEEICVTLDELNKKTEDVVKLRQTEINLQNLLTTRELEKGKMEDSYKDLCEKTQKREEELLYNIEQLQTEKASLSEKERNLIITKDTLKRDIKALQNDYKKACDLSDAKSEELKELIDKYVVSQKAVQQFQQRMIHAENSLKGCEQRLKDTCQEKDGVLQELAVKEEKLDAIKKELSTLSQEKHSQMASVQESVKEFSEKLNGEVAEKEKARKESQNLAEKLDEVQTALQNSDSQLALLREKSKNSNEIIHKKDQEINDLFKDLKSTESQIQNLEQKLNEKGNSTNELEQRCRRLELQHEEMSAIIKTKENEIVLHVNELENLKSVSEQETISLRQQVDTLEKEVTELRQKSPQLEDALRTKENEVLSTKDDLLRSIESLTQAQNELQLKVQELSELSSIKSSLEIKLNDAMGVVNEKQLYIDKQTKELNELQAAFDSRLSDVDSRREKEEAEMLQGKLQQLQQSLETSENKLNEAQEEMNVKHAELMDAHKECHKFKSLYDEIEKREADLLEQTQNLSASLDVKAKELETEREEHEKQQSTYDTYTSDYLTKECQLKEKIDGLTNELERITSCLNNKEEELKTALEKISSMKNECEELRSMMDESAEMAMNLEDQNLELKEKNEHLVTSLEGRNKDLAELKESQKQTEMSWMTSGEKYAADMEKRNDDVNILKQKLSRAHEIEESKANEIKSLKQRIDSDAVDKESIVSKMESLQSSNAALLEENSVLNQKMHHLSEITTIKDAEVATKTEELEGLKKKLDLEAQESLRVVADLTDKNSVLTARIVQHDEMMAAKHLELKDLRSKFEELSKEFDELKSHLEERTSTLESTREELRSLVTKTETLENLFNSKNDEMAIKSEELLKTTSEQQAEFQRKCDMLSSTTDTLNTALSEKEHLSHVLEAKEKDLLKLSQLHEENTKEKEDIIHKLSVVEDSLNVKSEEVKSLLDQQVHLKSMVSNLITEKDLIAKEENCTRLEANEEVTVLKGKLHELEEKVNTLVSVKEKLEYKSTHKEEELQKAKDLILQLQKDVDSLAAQKEILQMDFEDKDDVIDSLQKQISQHEQLVTELKHRSQEKEEKYISVTRDMEALRSQFEVTQMDIEDKEDVIEELKTKSQALESCVKSLKESNCVLEESLKKSQTALDETAKSLDDKTLDLETTALESGSMHLKAEELIQTLREAVDGLNKENRELERKGNGNESLVQSLKQEASDFQERIEAQNYEKQNMESVFSSNVMTWKQSKEALERQVQEFEKRLSVSSEAMETSKDELAALRTSMETERTNMSKNKQELLLKKESSEDELKATREKLQEYEEALVNTKNELAYATESKDLAESMLVAVDGNLQNCKHQLLEKENQLKVLERSLGGKEDEIVKLRDLSTLQQERLENVNQGLNANQQEKETQIREMLERMQNIEKCKEMEIESLSGEYKTRIDEIQKRHKLSLENVEQYKVKLTELEGALSSCKQEIVELNQRIDSNLAELQTKGFEIENLQTENKRFLYSRETLQNDLGSDIEWLKNEMSMTEEECKRLQDKLKDQEMINERKHEEYTVEVSSLRHENDSLQKQIQSLLSKIETMESELQGSGRRVEELETLLQENRESTCTENLTLQENLKEAEKCKAEIERKSVEERDLLVSEFKRKEGELTESLEYQKEQNTALIEEMDKLRDQIDTMRQSNEQLTREDEGMILQLKSRLDEADQKLKRTNDRVEELLEEKRVSYDAMQLAERETRQTRSELEHEISSSKSCLKKVTQEAENYKQQLEILQEEKGNLESKLKNMRSNALMFEQNSKDSDLKYQDKIAELASSLESTEADLSKVTSGKDEFSILLERSKSELEQAFESLARFESEKGNSDAVTNENQELKGTIDTFQEEILCLKTTQAELNSQLVDERETVCALRDQVELLRNDINTMESRHEMESTKLQQTSDNLEKQNAELSEKIITASESNQQQIKSQLQRFEEATSENVSLSANLDEKSSYAKQLEDSNDELLEVNEKLCEKIEKLEEVIEKSKQEMTSLRGTTNSANRDYEDAVQELQNLRQDSAEAINKREEKISELTHRLNEVRTSQEELAVEKNSLLQEKEDIVDQIASFAQLKEEFQNEADQRRVELQDLRAAMEEKTSRITELSTSAESIQQALDTKQREMDEMKSFFDDTNEELDAICEQRAEEVYKLKYELSTNSKVASDLELKLKDKEEEIEKLNERCNEINKEFESLTRKHELCKEYEPRIESLKQDLHQAQYALEQQKTNAEALMKSFEEREKQLEEEQEKVHRLALKTDEVREVESNVLADLSRAENEVKQLQNTLQLKEKELEAVQMRCDQNASACDEIEMQFKPKMEVLEQRCEEMKYTLKKKEDEIFVLKENVQDDEAKVENLEKKAACSEEIELELRHHLGEVTQELETLRESTASESVLNDDEKVYREELNDALQKISDLKEENELKEAQFEEKKTDIVEAAKDFAIKREDDFGQQLSAKDEQIHTLENEVHQLKHDLQLAQKLQKALLEAADDREKEFENTKTQLQDGGVVQGKLVELSLNLKLEKQKCQQLEENCNKLQESIDNGELTKVALQRQLDSLQKDHRAEEDRLDSNVTSLTQEIDAIQNELKQVQQSLTDETTRVKELSKENHNLTRALKVLKQQEQRARTVSTETEEECRVLKEQLNGLVCAQNEAEIEKERYIVNESNKKVKLGEIERNIERLKVELETEKKISCTLEDKALRFESELSTKMNDLTAVQKQNSNLEKTKAELELASENLKQNYEEHVKTHEELKGLYKKEKEEHVKCVRKLKNTENEISSLRDHQTEEFEFTKTQLLLAEDKCSNLSEEIIDFKKAEATLQDDWTRKSSTLQLRVDELATSVPQLRTKISELESENQSLRLKLEGQAAKSKSDGNEQMKEILKGLEKKLSQKESRLNEKEKQAIEKEDEYNVLLKKYKNLERQNLSLQGRLQFAAENLKHDNKPVESNEHQKKDQKSPEAAASAISQASGVFSPLARSMSSLGITTTSTVTKNVEQPVKSFLQAPRPVQKAMGIPVRRENKRTLEHETYSIPKRSRLTSPGISVPGPSVPCDSPELPEGLPEVVRKGFNDIPTLPIKSPFILRRTTAQVSKTTSAIPQQSARTRLTQIPKFNRDATKENPSAVRSSPPRGLARPPTTVLSPRKTNIPSKSSKCSPKKSNIPGIATRRRQQSRPSKRPNTRSSAKQPVSFTQIEGSPNAEKDDVETCAMQ